MLRRARAVTLVMAGPMSLFAYHPLHAMASTHDATCDGMSATKVVTAGSPHVVHGTSPRDVITTRAPGPAGRARGGNDVSCGSSGHDTGFGGSGHATVLATGGNADV